MRRLPPLTLRWATIRFPERVRPGVATQLPGKIQSLNQLISTYPSSQYVDDALYEQGRAFVQLEDNANAIKRYSLLVERFPESPLSRKAANEIGLLYYQDDNYNQSIAAYKKVIQSYPGSEEAKLAQRDLKSIYVDLNKVDEYMAYTSNLPGGVQFDASERDSLTYVAAEKHICGVTSRELLPVLPVISSRSRRVLSA